MKTQGIVLKEKEFMAFYNAIIDKLLVKYREMKVTFKDGAKTKVWTHMIQDRYCLHDILKEGVTDAKAIRVIESLEPKHLYRQYRVFENANVGITIEEWQLDIYSKFLGFKSFKAFQDQAIRTKDNLEEMDEVSMVRTGSRTVEQFYEDIAATRYDFAWKLLSKDFQERIWGKKVDLPNLSAEENNAKRFESFKRGYFFFRALFNTHVFHPRMIGSSTMECMVYYQAELELPIINELVQIFDSTINQIDTFSESVQKLSEIVQDLGGREFDKRFISRLFLRDAIDFIWFICDIDPAVLKSRYDVRTTNPPITMLFTCKCIIEDGKWKIHRLVPCRC